MPGCDYSPAVRHWAHLYTESASGFSASLSQALPFLLVVLDQIEQRDLPGEFAFLPYIESNYTPLASSGDRAAGIWQLMPDTAREAGLRIAPDYDGRLDVYASTTAALDLLQRYQQEFGDWRLANMAFNAGEYRVKSLVGGDDKSARSAAELDRLRLNPRTHAHLAKLLALACIVSDPEHFNVELPEPQTDAALAVLDFPAPVDLRLAAHLADIDAARLQRLNPGYLHGHMPANGPFRLLLPASHRDSMVSTLAKLPQSSWRDWHEVVLKQTQSLNVFASANNVDPATLAAVNPVDDNAPLAPGTRLLLPGLADRTGSAAQNVTLIAQATSSAPVIVVHAGDTLWRIARRQHVRLDDLLSWNGLDRNATLHLGQPLRLHASLVTADGQATASAAAAAAN